MKNKPSCEVCNDSGRVVLFDTDAPKGTAAYAFRCDCVRGNRWSAYPPAKEADLQYQPERRENGNNN